MTVGRVWLAGVEYEICADDVRLRGGRIVVIHPRDMRPVSGDVMPDDLDDDPCFARFCAVVRTC